ncbi:2Fe-2S iron-sulfur cluster-binding protein [Aurantiacibacter zhengii]|uniref:(2Fe-2S)-binding protein n=1 Tax=Aurantiacibacter zhengii TaxID=2307003 RepID=A0A418NUF5_9SPHN|nr:2Fe-2S iron-sulfur cluster-binding protein [Aurantiacibacter zhengii]RIV87716.1 (2Fe-2S)-binding protein [Aurantiacibacter zhengii]
MPITINDTPHDLPDDPRVSLLDFLRSHAGLTGTKKGCDHGQCGACTVLVNGVRINSCLSLAVTHDGDEVTTIEGLGSPVSPSEMQQAFLRHDGFQCGYCTPGQICSATAMLKEIAAGWPSDATDDLEASPKLTGEEIRERMSGNLCRCGAYANIVAAIRDVAGENA